MKLTIDSQEQLRKKYGAFTSSGYVHKTKITLYIHSNNVSIDTTGYTVGNNDSRW